MTLGQQGCFDNCFSNVTLIVEDLQVLTGQIVCTKSRDDGSNPDSTPPAAVQSQPPQVRSADIDDEFITIELTSPMLIIPGGAGPAVVQPFFVVGDRVRVNVRNIVTIGPSHV